MLKNVVSLYLFIAVLLTAYFATYMLSKGKSSYMKVFSILSFCVSLYLFGYLLEINSSALEQMLFWNQVQFFGLPFISALWLMVALLYTKRIQVLQERTMVLLFFVPVLTFFLRLTNSFHYLYYKGMGVQQSSQFLVLDLQKGPGYYVQSAYIWLTLILINLVFYEEYRKRIRSDHARFRVLLIASLIPYIGIILIFINFLGLGLDYTALLIPISLFLILFAIIRFDFLEIKTLARETMFENSADAMVLLDKELRIMDYNRAAQDFFSSLGMSLQNKNMESLLAGEQGLLAIFRGETSSDFKFLIGGEELFAEISSTLIQDVYGKNIGCLKTIRDITDRKMMQEQLKRLANIDALSGLNNRAHFIQLSQKEFQRAKRFNHVFSVIMMDIDRFKLINDTKGHAAGDAVIQEMGRLISGTFRTTDISGRLGGEEFAVVLTNTSIHDAYRVAELFRETVAGTSVLYNNTKINLTISIGITSYYREAESIEEILRYADEALYASKAEGRNCINLKFHQPI